MIDLPNPRSRSGLFSVFFDDGNRSSEYPNTVGGAPQSDPSEANSSTVAYLGVNTHTIPKYFERQEAIISEWIENYQNLDPEKQKLVENMFMTTVDVVTFFAVEELDMTHQQAREKVFDQRILDLFYGQEN